MVVDPPRPAHRRGVLDISQDWKLRMNNLHKVYDVVTSRIRKSQDRQAKYFNKKHREVTLEIGDIVLRRNRILSSAADKIAAKLAPKYNGPYVVTGKQIRTFI